MKLEIVHLNHQHNDEENIFDSLEYKQVSCEGLLEVNMCYEIEEFTVNEDGITIHKMKIKSISPILYKE